MAGPTRTQPHARFVALGASNLTRALPTLVAAARASAAGPVDCIVAAGNGRSFGAPSRFLGRQLPGILESRVFERLDGPRRGIGAVLDVGNDLLYGSSVPTILTWVDACLSRLAPHVTRLALGGLPPVEGGVITPFRFELIRRVLVPSCRLTLDEAVSAARELGAGLQALATQHRAAFVDLPGQYFGRDPIHVLARRHVDLLGRLAGVDSRKIRDSGLRAAEAARVRLARPSAEILLGVPRHRETPQLRLRDGTTLTLD